MGRIIAIANQKGGVGKTTTVINLGASLATAEKRVLLVDFDPQANCTSGLGFSKKELSRNAYSVLAGDAPVQDALLECAFERLFLLPSSISLAGAEVELVAMDNREFVLKNILNTIREDFDYILIDCPPSLGLLTVNALVASDQVLIPLQAEYFAMEGMSELLGTLDRVRSSLNPDLEIQGILLTLVDDRTNLAKQVAEEVRRHFGTLVYQCQIPRNVRLAEAPSFGKPILFYDIGSRGAQCYLNMAQEFLSHEA
jgi:chromosome partitioning protein